MPGLQEVLSLTCRAIEVLLRRIEPDLFDVLAVRCSRQGILCQFHLDQCASRHVLTRVGSLTATKDLHWWKWPRLRAERVYFLNVDYMDRSQNNQPPPPPESNCVVTSKLLSRGMAFLLVLGFD